MAEISYEVKKKCVELKQSGMNSREIYTQYFASMHQGMAYETFRSKLKLWQKRPVFADPETLERGTYEGFIAHGATVQVGRNGEIVQAWIKEHADENQMQKLLECIEENTTPVEIKRPTEKSEPEMLEIPLFDQHFPQNDHIAVFGELIQIVESRQWEEINIIIGQDMLHNDDMRGRVSSGAPIEKVDIVKGWELARVFYYSLISNALRNAGRVKVIYSKGNHDESLSWAFVQMLKAMFPQAEFDDSLWQRKCIAWRDCFIGVTHGAYKRSSMDDLRGQFTIQFPMEFASSKVREIHAGHLHREEEKDIYGVMCRRLARSGKEDEWADDEGYIGANKRFMVFRWKPGRLAGIDYL